MSGGRQRSLRPSTSSRAVLLVGAIGAAMPLALASVGAADPTPALAAAAVIAIAAIATCLRVSRVSSDTGAAADAPAPPVPGPLAHFGEMLEALTDPVMLVEGARLKDTNARRYVFANSAARELLRIQRPEGPLTTALRSPEVLRAVDEALLGRVVGVAEYETGGVQSRVWRVRAAPLGSRGIAGGVALLTLRDETEIRRSERTRADFLANASHELRTPLASLSGFIETLRGHARDDAVARDRFLAIMHEQAERMRRLIDGLMSLSRIELSEHVPPSGEVDVGLATMDVLEALAPLAVERKIEFKIALPAAGEASVTGDRDQIIQVVQNLAENALKYGPTAGVVGVEVLTRFDHMAAAGPDGATSARFSLLTPDHSSGRRFVALRVRDAGPGIAREHLPRLTERFYRVEGQRSSERGGTGLGLAIVKHIMNRHRGGLTVESAEGEGAMFTALFPSREPPADTKLDANLP